MSACGAAVSKREDELRRLFPSAFAGAEPAPGTPSPDEPGYVGAARRLFPSSFQTEQSSARSQFDEAADEAVRRIAEERKENPPGIADRIRQGLGSIFSRVMQDRAEFEAGKLAEQAQQGTALDFGQVEQAFAQAGAPVTVDPESATGVLQNPQQLDAAEIARLETGQAPVDPAMVGVDPVTGQQVQGEIVPVVDPMTGQVNAAPEVAGAPSAQLVGVSPGELEQAALQEAANVAFREQELLGSRRLGALKRGRQVATTGLRNAPGVLGALGRTLKPEDSLVEQLIENDVIQLTSGERGIELAGFAAPAVLEVLLTKKLARSAAARLGPDSAAGRLANLVGRPDAQGNRLGAAATGVLEGVPTDLAIAIENHDAGELGLGAGIGAVMGVLMPGGGVVADELAQFAKESPQDAAEAIADMVARAERQSLSDLGEDGSESIVEMARNFDTELPSQLEAAMARAVREGDDELAAALDDTLDALPDAMELARRRLEPEAPRETPEPEGAIETPRPREQAAGTGELPTQREVAQRNAAPEPEIEVVPVRESRPRDELREIADRPSPEPEARRVTQEGQAGAPGQARFTVREIPREPPAADAVVREAEPPPVDPAAQRQEVPAPDVGERRARIRRRLGDLESPELRRELQQSREAVARQEQELSEAFTDPMTNLANPTAYGRARDRIDADPDLQVVSADAINLKAFNDEISPQAGDAYLAQMADAMRQTAEEFGVPTRNVFRAGGDEFVAAVPRDVDADAFLRRAEELAAEPVVDGTIYSGGLRGGVGDTRAIADEGLAAAKAAYDKPKYRDKPAAGSQVPEDLLAPNTEELARDAARAADEAGGVSRVGPQRFDQPAGEALSPAALAERTARNEAELDAFFRGDDVPAPRGFRTDRGGYIASPALLRTLAFPTTAAAVGAGTANDPEDAAGRAGLGFTAGLMAGLTPSAMKYILDNNPRAAQLLTPGGTLVGALRGNGRVVQEAMRDSLGRLAGQAQEADVIIRKTMGDVASASREAYGAGPRRISAQLSSANPFEAMPEGDVALVNRFLEGDATALGQLPEPMRAPIAQMRQQIDRYSHMFLKEGIVEGELRTTFDKRLGMHLTRSYRVFDDPEWMENAPRVLGEAQWEQVKNNFKAWYRDAVGEDFVSEDEVERIMRDYLAVGDELNPIRAIQSGRMGKLTPAVLKRRKELPAEIRALWGEHDDPYVNFARTITNQANYIANYRFLRQFREMGLGEGFLYNEGLTPTARPSPIGGRPVEMTAQLAGEGSATLAPLRGLRTTPEIARAFQDQFSSSGMTQHVALNALLAFGTASKVAKTVLSQTTHIRNLIGNTAFALVNGYGTQPFQGAKAWNQSVRTLLPEAFGSGSAAARAEVEKLTRLGVIANTARAGELQEAIDRLGNRSLGEHIDRMGSVPIAGGPIRGMQAVWEAMPGTEAAERAASTAYGAGQNAFNSAFKMYQVEDDLWKMMAWNMERGRYAEAMQSAGRDISEEELDEMAARVVRNTWPSFDQTPEAVRQLGRVGGFVSFPAEVFRTIHGTMKTIEDELADAATRDIGIRRLLSAAGTAAGLGGLGMASRGVHNITSDEEDAVREFQPEWSEFSSFFHLSPIRDGEFNVVDLSYMMPYSYLQEPINAFLRGDDWRETAKNTLNGLASPWVAANPGWSSIVDELTDYHERDVSEEIMRGIVRGLSPSVIEQYARLTSGYSSGLQPLSRWKEAGALALGLRGQKTDVREAVVYDIRDFRNAISAAKSELNRANRRGRVDRFGDQEQEFQGLIDEKVDEMEAAYRMMHRKVNAMMTLGVPYGDIEAILKKEGVTESDRRIILSGAGGAQ